MSVGFEIPGKSVEFIDFKSSSSLLDADTIIFAPNIESYSYYERYEGKPRMSDEDSAQLVRDSAHWRRELAIALGSGKTVFLFMIGVADVWVFSGQKQYAGTGRNARVTNIVMPFDPYTTIPVDGLAGSVQRRTGDRIKATDWLGILAPYWQEFGPYTSYQVYLEKSIGTPSLVTQTGDKMVGGIFQFKDLKGALVLLPPPDFNEAISAREKQLAERKKRKAGASKPNRTEAQQLAAWTRAEASVEMQFLSAIGGIDKALRSRSERTPAPLWALEAQYVLKEEAILRARATELEEKINNLRVQKSEVETLLTSAGDLRGLLFETGKPLESSILEALRHMGFRADNFVDQESEFDVVFEDTDGTRFIGEVEGKNDKAVNIDKLAQLERNIQEDFKKRDDNVYARGVLFGNAFRLVVPTERGEFFTEKCITGAKRSGVALVKTPDLFEIARYLKENPDPAFAETCRDCIKGTTGETVSFPAIPLSPRAEHPAVESINELT
jgi:hypothetical protein